MISLRIVILYDDYVRGSPNGVSRSFRVQIEDAYDLRHIVMSAFVFASGLLVYVFFYVMAFLSGIA